MKIKRTCEKLDIESEVEDKENTQTDNIDSYEKITSDTTFNDDFDFSRNNIRFSIETSKKILKKVADEINYNPANSRLIEAASRLLENIERSSIDYLNLSDTAVRIHNASREVENEQNCLSGGRGTTNINNAIIINGSVADILKLKKVDETKSLPEIVEEVKVSCVETENEKR